MLAAILVADPGTIQGWLELRVDAATVFGEAAGDRPFLGPAAGFGLGLRFHRVAGLYAGITTFAIDRTEPFEDSINGDPPLPPRHWKYLYEQLIAFDVFTLRFFVPNRSIVEPHFDVGATVAVRRDKGEPLAGRTYAGGRLGVGVDFWIGRHLTLGISADERVFRYERGYGHAFLAGFNGALHW